VLFLKKSEWERSENKKKRIKPTWDVWGGRKKGAHPQQKGKRCAPKEKRMSRVKRVAQLQWPVRIYGETISRVGTYADGVKRKREMETKRRRHHREGEYYS